MFGYISPFGYFAHGKTIGETWLELVRAVLELGEESYDEKRKRLALQAIKIKSQKQNFPDSLIERYGKKEFVKALLDLTFKENKMYDFDMVPNFSPGAASYFKRISDGNMIHFVVERLSRFPESKKGVMSFINWKDYEAVLESPKDDYLPCICIIQFRLLPPKYDTMNTIFYARSIDAFQKANGNLLAMAKLSRQIARNLGKNLKRKIKVGSLEGLIADAHIYSECYNNAKKLIKRV